MRTEAVRAQLAARGLGDRYREFTVSSATVALAGESPRRCPSSLPPVPCWW